jgi:hypothetical protein
MDYVIPLKVGRDADITELARYANGVAETAGVIVVDGSEPAIFERNSRLFGARVRHVGPLPEFECLNGKVAGARTGFRLSASEKLVLADDDVRYRPDQLQRIERELDDADIVVPQNYFDPLPWHARWDTARILLNRALGQDYPGTVALRMTESLRRSGYDGDVLFENLELFRTVKAAGGRERILLDLLVCRRPPSATHFVAQRIRQAYDSHAQPWRMAGELSLLPGLVAVLRRPKARAKYAFLVWAALSVTVEWGRRRQGGRPYFPGTSAAWVLPWLLERGVCVWIAVILRSTGQGVAYAGGRIVRAATPMSRLKRAT